MSRWNEDRRDREINEFRDDMRQTSHAMSIFGFHWFIWVIVAMIAVALLGIVGANLEWWAAWQREPLERTSVTNVKKEYTAFYDARRGLEASANNIRGTEGQITNLKTLNGEDVSRWPVEAKLTFQSLTESLSSQRDGYNDLCAEYLAMWDNEFRSSVAPQDLPRSCEYLNP